MRLSSWDFAIGLLVVCWIAGCGLEESRPTDELSSAPRDSADQEDHSELIAELEELRQAGRYREALALVQQQLELSPNAALLRFQLGLLLHSTGELDAAEAALLRALELEPAHYPSHRALGDLARLRGAPAQAADHFQRCVSGLPEHAGCRYGLALALVDLGEIDAAAEHLIPAAERLNRADVFSELGQLERRRGRLGESIVAFSQALALDRFHLPTLLGMGQVLVAKGRRDEGQALLERHREEASRQDEIDALRRSADQPGAGAGILIQLARHYRLREDHESTEAALREALENSPGFPAATLGLANHLVHHGDAAEADRLVDSLMPQMEGNAAVLFLQGTIDLALGDADAASVHFDASLAQGSWPPSVYLDAGQAWSKAGRHGKAIRAYEKALSGLPEPAAALLGLARSQRAQGALERARDSIIRAIDPEAPDGQALLLRAVLATELGESGSVKLFEAALEARKLEMLAAGGAGEIRRELEDLAAPKSAFEHFDRALAALASQG